MKHEETNRHIVAATPENFTLLVMENSSKGPLLVYYWSRHAGPCMRLLPRLVNLADEFAGRFLLALLYVDDHQQFARDCGISGVPTVVVYLHGEEVETVRGAYTGSLFRRIVEKYLPPATAGNTPQKRSRSARDEYGNRERISDDGGPPIDRDYLDRAKILVHSGDPIAAAALLDQLPDSALQDPEINLLYTHLNLVRTAESAPNRDSLERRLREHPDDHAIRYQLSARQLIDDDYELAIQNLLQLTTTADAVLGRSARQGLLAIMAMLGPQHHLTRKYQPKILVQIS